MAEIIHTIVPLVLAVWMVLVTYILRLLLDDYTRRSRGESSRPVDHHRQGEDG